MNKNVEYKKLYDICDFISGGTPSKSKIEYWKDGNIPWIKISDFKEKYIKSSDEKITRAGLDNSSAKILEKGTILYTIFASIGKVAILDIEATTNQAIVGINLKKDVSIDKDFLYYFLCSIEKNMKNQARGVAQNNINISILKNVNIPIFSLTFQKSISNNIKKVENILENLKKKKSLIDFLKKSLFTSIFGDIKNNDKNWEIKKIEDCVLNNVKNINLKTNGRISYIDISSIDNKKNKILSYKEYDNINEAPSRAKKILNENDILISTVRPILKNIAIFNKKKSELTIASTGFCILRSKNTINSKYIFEIIKSDNFTETLIKKQIGANYPAVSDRDIKSIKIPVPPIELQNKFAERIEKIEKLKFDVWKKIKNL